MATLRREILCKRLRDVLKTLLPSREFFAKRADGTVSSNYIAVARIRVENADSWKIEWNTAAADQVVLARLRALNLQGAPEWI